MVQRNLTPIVQGSAIVPCRVYVIAWRDRGPSKVGVAEVAIRRLAELQGANPFKLFIYFNWQAASAKVAHKIETRVLRDLHAVRLQGEWLRASPNQVRQAVLYAARALSIALVSEPAPTAREAAAWRQRLREADALAEYNYFRDMT